MVDKVKFNLLNGRLEIVELDNNPSLDYTKADLANLDSITNANGDTFVRFTESTPSSDYLNVVQNGTASVQLTIDGTSNDADLELFAKGAGNVSISGYKLPNTDGNAGQVLQTDGNGNISFVDQSGGGTGTTQNLFENVNADTGSTTADTATDTLTVAGGFGMSTTLVGDTLTLDFVDVINRWQTFTGDSGSTTADTETDSFTVTGGANITTSVAGDTLTIDTSAIAALSDDGSPTLGSNLDLNGFDIIDLTGSVTIDGINYPSTDGEEGNVLQTDGNGNLVFSETKLRSDTVATSSATTTTISSVTIPTGEQRVITAKAYGFESATNDMRWVVAHAGFKNVGGTVTQVGGVSSQSGTDTGATAWVIDFVPSSNTVNISVTGEAAHNIDWKANIEVI